MSKHEGCAHEKLGAQGEWVRDDEGTVCNRCHIRPEGRTPVKAVPEDKPPAKNVRITK